MDKNNVLRNFLTRHADSAVAAICGFVMLSFFTRYGGIGVSPDSVMYMSGARNLNAHRGFTYWGSKPLVAFPFFYPTFLAVLLSITGIDPLVMAPILNGLLFASLIFMVGFTLEYFASPAKWYKWFILAAIVFSPSLLDIYSMLWSETLFIVWSLVFILVYHHYFKQRSIGSLLALTTVAALACVTRYAGVTLIGTGGMLLFFDPQLKIIQKTKHLAVFVAGSLSLLAANLIYNNMVSHTGTGPRYKSLTSLTENMHYFGIVMCDWITISPAHYGWATGITTILLVLIILAFCNHAWIKKTRYGLYENGYLAFFIVYGLFMIISATISRYERINNRLLSPLFIPFIISCTYWVVPVVKKQEAKFRRMLYVLALGLSTLFLYKEIEIDYLRYDDQGEYGTPGYTDDDWNKSDLIKTMKTRPQLFNPAYPIYNNACDAFYFFTGKSSEYIPKPNAPAELKKFDTAQHGYVVIFNNLPDPALLTIPQIQQHKKQLKVLYQFADGGIYEF